MPVIGPNEKFTRYEDGGVSFPNGSYYDPEDRVVRRPPAPFNPHGEFFNALMKAMANRPGSDMIDIRNLPPEMAKRLVGPQVQTRPVLFPPNSPLGKLQRAYGVR